MTEPAHPGEPRPRAVLLFAYPFRIFFLSAALLAALVVPAWLLLFFTGAAPALLMPGFYWHQHEMLFGFLDAAIAGFLLTAVCAWTGTERLHGAWLFALWAVWMAGRGAWLSAAWLPAPLAHTIDLAFLPLVMVDAGRRIWARRQYRQLIVVAILAGLWGMELGFHLRPGGPYARAALILAMALMLVIGGRITPSFSGNWLRQQGRDPAQIRTVPALERLLLVALGLLLVAELFGLSPLLRAGAAILAALSSAVRLMLWRGWQVRREPLLWVLHLALAWIPVALLLLAAAAMGWVAPSVWVHAAGAGGMGTLILGVMSRVALGHTGRPLRVVPAISAAFVIAIAAGMVRVLTAAGGLPMHAGLGLGAALWSSAFVIFLLYYWRMLASPRADGRPG